MSQISQAIAPRENIACEQANSYGAIDRWQPVELISEGQWTRVFQARPEGCAEDWPSDYVIKVLKSEYEDDELARRQIQCEAAVGRRVTNPNLVSILTSRTESPPYYVVMPYVEGVTLAALLLNDHSFPLPQSLWFARQTAQALQALHLAGWMHADVKPSNILASPQGHVTLVDLGFARNFNRRGSGVCELVGTMNYAAPEFFLDKSGRDGQSDVYSLGITLFEMLTRRLPFVQQDATQLALAHLREQPPDPRTLNPSLPPRLVRLLRRMLAKEPARRPEADEVVSILFELEIETFDER